MSRTILKYDIATSANGHEAFLKILNEKVAEGWQVDGPLCITDYPRPHYVQRLVRTFPTRDDVIERVAEKMVIEAALDALGDLKELCHIALKKYQETIADERFADIPVEVAFGEGIHDHELVEAKAKYLSYVKRYKKLRDALYHTGQLPDGWDDGEI